MLKKIVFIAFIFLTTVIYSQQHITTGPEKGSLVIVGGGRVGTEIIEKFIALAGGKDAPIVVIPTAAGQPSYDQNWGFAVQLRNHGATNVTVLHTADPKEADTDTFIKPLQKAKGVWFTGGRQWRLADSYAGTKTEKKLWDILTKGGVIGGSSAGATIQGSYLARGDSKSNQVMMGDHEIGFGFVKNIAIDQHVLARNRQFDMFTILKERPELLGIGIDESTAMVVQGNTFEVIGASKVLIYDGTFWSREGTDLKEVPAKGSRFYFLQKGDRYDLKERKVIN